MTRVPTGSSWSPLRHSWPRGADVLAVEHLAGGVQAALGVDPAVLGAQDSGGVGGNAGAGGDADRLAVGEPLGLRVPGQHALLPHLPGAGAGDRPAVHRGGVEGGQVGERVERGGQGQAEGVGERYGRRGRGGCGSARRGPRSPGPGSRGWPGAARRAARRAPAGPRRVSGPGCRPYRRSAAPRGVPSPGPGPPRRRGRRCLRRAPRPGCRGRSCGVRGARAPAAPGRVGAALLRPAQRQRGGLAGGLGDGLGA